MTNTTDDRSEIIAALERYFSGIFDGDVAALDALYHPYTVLVGDLKGQPYERTLVLYLNGVRCRQCPRDSGSPFKGEVISIILINTIAVAQLRIVMFDAEYHELLSFHKLEDRWFIVHKLVSDIPR